MLDVLLVDDEPWVLEGLRTMVNWDKYGFQICGEAENGNVAWAMIEKTSAGSRVHGYSNAFSEWP